MAKDDKDDSIEILSSPYRPTRSTHGSSLQVDNRAASEKVNGKKRHSDLPLQPCRTTKGGKGELPDSHRPIRSVDDYERGQQQTYYFQQSTARSAEGGAASSNSMGSKGDRKSVAKPGSSKEGYRNGEMKLQSTSTLVDAESATSSTKEPLTAEEKKRKRITLAVGIIAGVIIVASILLVAVTLNMTSKIDAIVKQESDNLYAQLTSSKGDYGIAWKNSSASLSFPVLQYANRDN
ncbi:hypothetical protein BV898_00707 [Hypsibius exemplaris]|uniref:Uncharacterized protein n=1 Tax=Hypsibius exemplaris TaxID=2072580 RepID=A0A1W0XEJ4_HYPEX|nr:hypothetical protein BV898_00707 [Hypsibius exemplaris]